MTTTFRRRAAALLATTFLACAVVGCAAPERPEIAATALDGDGVDGGGAAEVAEPARALIIADERGGLTLLDLATEDRQVIAEPQSERVAGVEGTGRFVYVVREGAVEVVDSGRWTMPHGDHSHYFRGEPRTVGAVDGDGQALIGVGADATVIRFEDEAAVLEHEPLGEGAVDPARSAIDGGGPAIVVAGHLLIATDAGIAGVDASAVPCQAASDVDLTRVGTVFACAEGAVLVSREVDGTVSSESIPYPAGVAAPALTLSGRPDRPDLAGVSVDGGAWLLDVRERTWTLLTSDVPLVDAAAIGDDDGRTAVIASDGSVRILAADGTVLARTDPLLADALADPALSERLQLLVDGDHAYVPDPATGSVHEIDLDDGRVTRTFSDLRLWAVELVG
ncbi:MAG: hypothetical protein JF592_17300 [Microbacterium sp.]|uniref:hypothetical protein n=1 Tax=Microbacterium sp. TaxID=51671 RepID=UPI001D6A87CA|nr:hypothetical protein [Microbacterium sp.]MBW8764306.1 hypothetical protein [Microbacterium sp.]